MLNRLISARLLALPRPQKQLLALTLDTLICVWTVRAALYLRLEEWVPLTGNHWLAVAVALLLATPIFIRGGLYRAIFRYTGWPAMLAVIRACLVYGAAYALIFTFVSVPGVPRTVGLIQPVLLFLAIAASRAVLHHLFSSQYRGREEDGRNVLIYGAGHTGRELAAAVAKSPSMRLVGFLDDDSAVQGAYLSGVKIYNPLRAPELIQRLGVADILLAIPTASKRRRREIVELLRGTAVNVRTLPALIDLAHGRIEVSELRSIEIDELLGRDPVPPDLALLDRAISGHVVMITGAGGSIGSELCRQILDLRPSVLMLVEASEFALYSIDQELRARPAAAEVTIVPLLASVRDEPRMRAIMSAWRPGVIYHAAAYKHVPLVEHNVLEGIDNNALGTRVLAGLARELGTANFVLVSSDKAVRPTNVMGASKRLAEMILQAFASEGGRTRFSMVRFGNVLGSSGSVVPLFRQQIAAGGPVTITHPDVTRYFMTIPEAAQLVIHAGSMATGGEVFVLDMGEAVRVYDLAVNMIQLFGLTIRDEANPLGDIEIEVVGLRPGEKLYEELLIGGDPEPTRHERIMKAHEHHLPRDVLEPALAGLRTAIAASNAEQALRILASIVDEYRPEPQIVDHHTQQVRGLRPDAHAVPWTVPASAGGALPPPRLAPLLG